MNKSAEQCFRCGGRIDPMGGSEAVYDGAAVWQHRGCAEFYRGTKIHHRKAPALLAPVETYAHTFGPGDSLLFLVSNLRWRAIHNRQRVIIGGLADIDLDHMFRAREMTPQDALAVRERRIERGTWDDPGIIVLLDRFDGYHLIVDGNHRAAARKMLGEESMRFYEFRQSELGSDCWTNPNLEMMRAYMVPNAAESGLI